MVKIHLKLFILLLFISFAIGQSDVQFTFQKAVHMAQKDLKKHNNVKKASSSFWEKTGLAQLGYLIISTYQQFISSQDAPACNYYPSCSHFAQDALKYVAFPKNILLISDRLQRCNGLPGKEKHYPFLPEKGRFYDPITKYISQPR